MKMRKYYHIPPFVLQTLIWIPTRLALLFFIKFEIKGAENLKNLESGVIFASNHASALDPILVPAALPMLSRFIPMFYPSREKDFYERKLIRFFMSFNWMYRAWGAYPVKIGVHNYEESLAYHVQILKDGMNILIFPEGGVTKDGKLKEGKGGVSFLAHKLNKVIVPIGINSTYKLSLKKFIKRKRKVTLTFGEPISPKDLFNGEKKISIDDYKKISQEVIMKKIAELI